MPGKVIRVQRQEKLGLLERLYLPMILRGLFVTSTHFFRNLRGFLTGANRTDFVVQYPEERLDYPDAFRGMPVLVALLVVVALLAAGVLLVRFRRPLATLMVDWNMLRPWLEPHREAYEQMYRLSLVLMGILFIVTALYMVMRSLLA